MPPTYLSVMTLNLWKTFCWPEREASLRALMQTFRPDVLCLQEAQPETLEAIDDALPGHERVRDDAFAGWEEESSIYWNGERLEKAAHGIEPINEMQERRQLFWARLRLREDEGRRTLLAATAHFTWPGHTQEAQTRRSPRPEQAQRTVVGLQRVAKEGEPVLFTGDLNEDYYPRKILADAGLIDPFTRLRIPHEPTRPARPIDFRPDGVHDWIVTNDHARPLAAHVARFTHEMMPPSDHWPVVAVYALF